MLHVPGCLVLENLPRTILQRRLRVPGLSKRHRGRHCFLGRTTSRHDICQHREHVTRHYPSSFNPLSFFLAFFSGAGGGGVGPVSPQDTHSKTYESILFPDDHGYAETGIKCRTQSAELEGRDANFKRPRQLLAAECCLNSPDTGSTQTIGSETKLPRAACQAVS